MRYCGKWRGIYSLYLPQVCLSWKGGRPKEMGWGLTLDAIRGPCSCERSPSYLTWKDDVEGEGVYTDPWGLFYRCLSQACNWRKGGWPIEVGWTLTFLATTCGGCTHLHEQDTMGITPIFNLPTSTDASIYLKLQCSNAAQHACIPTNWMQEGERKQCLCLYVCWSRVGHMCWPT